MHKITLVLSGLHRDRWVYLAASHPRMSNNIGFEIVQLCLYLPKYYVWKCTNKCGLKKLKCFFTLVL